MEKAIKFRGQRVDNKQWVYGYLISDCEIGSYYVFKNTISQFTGLFDENKREIYLGDLYTDENNELWKVVEMNCGRYALRCLESGYIDEFISWESIILKNN